MKVGVVGIGGVGGYFGGRLAQAGNDVWFIARGKNLEALHQNGLRVESIQGDFSLPQVQATDNAGDAGTVDVVLVAVKAWQVPEAAQQIRGMVGPQTMVLPLQNGVEAHDQLASIFGAERVLGGLCHIIAFLDQPGVIRHSGIKPVVTLGEWDNTRTLRVMDLMKCFNEAGIDARIPENIQSALWDKFMYIAAFAGVGSVTRAPIGIMRTVPQTRCLLKGALEEIVALAHVHGIPLPDTSAAKTLSFIDKLPPEGTTSMQRDIAAGLPSELEATNGAAVRLGRAKRVSVPIHEFIYGALLPAEMRARGKVAF